jgi:uncharacterized membrane protein YsdA (DUF1294 family)
MFLELNTGVYVIISLILFFIYFFNKYSDNNFNTTTQIYASLWCLSSLIVGAFISINSGKIDNGTHDTNTTGITYLVCSLVLITSSLIVTWGSS